MPSKVTCERCSPTKHMSTGCGSANCLAIRTISDEDVMSDFNFHFEPFTNERWGIHYPSVLTADLPNGNKWRRVDGNIKELIKSCKRYLNIY